MPYFGGRAHKYEYQNPNYTYFLQINVLVPKYESQDKKLSAEIKPLPNSRIKIE